MKIKLEWLNIIFTTLIVIILAVFFVNYKNINKISSSYGVSYLPEEKIQNFFPSCIGEAFTLESLSLQDSYRCYSLILYLPDGMQDISIMLPGSFCYFQFRIDDNVVDTHDAFSKDALLPTPHVIDYHTESDHIKLSLYIQNDSYHRITPYSNITLAASFRIGSLRQIHNYRIFLEIIEFVLILLFIISFLTHAMFFFNRKYNKIHLSIFLISISENILLLFNNQNISKYYFPLMTMDLGTKLDVLAYALRIAGFLILLNALFRQKEAEHLANILHPINTLIAIFFMIMPSEMYATFSLFYYLMTVVTAGLGLYLSIKMLIKTQNDIYSSEAVCFEILLLGSVFEALYCFGLTRLCLIYPYFLLLFFVIQTRNLSVKYYDSLNNIQKLTPLLKDKVFELQNNRSTYISAHIKPDYLYETLDAIYLAIDKNQNKVDELIQSLATYLRQTLDFSDSKLYHPLSEEIKYCKAFITLTRYTRPDIIFHINIDEALPPIMLPKYSIQSILENSIKHGFKGTLHPELTLNIKKHASYISISVADNGQGMTKEEIKFALERPAGNLDMGLYHIDQLLRDEFNSSLHIESHLNKRTTVEFNIGYEEGIKNV